MSISKTEQMDAAVRITVAALDAGAVKFHGMDNESNAKHVTSLFKAVADAVAAETKGGASTAV